MSLPSKMRAVEVSAPGGPEVLKPVERPVPSPKPGEILIKVAAAGVNRPEVASTGNQVSKVKVGDKVCALVHGGGYAEYCIAPEGTALPFPKGFSAVEAASLPETFFTVYGNVYDRAKLAPGESILVQGGSSGIGVTAIQMAKATGNRVFATAGSEEKVAACVRLGADKAFNYKTQDWAAELKAATGGKGVNVILDMVGGDYVPKELKVLADDGRLVFIAFLRGAKTEMDINEVMRRRLTISGSTLRPRTVEFKSYLAKNLLEKIWPLIDAGKIRPEIFKTFALAQAADAHRLMETSQHIGKIVLTL
jgi:NADPH2:quinone reductase